GGRVEVYLRWYLATCASSSLTPSTHPGQSDDCEKREECPRFQKETSLSSHRGARLIVPRRHSRVFPSTYQPFGWNKSHQGPRKEPNAHAPKECLDAVMPLSLGISREKINPNSSVRNESRRRIRTIRRRLEAVKGPLR